jgi:hypothetical protein
MQFDLTQKMKMVFNEKLEVNNKKYKFPKTTRYIIQAINFAYLLGGWVYIAEFFESFIVEYDFGVVSTILSLMTMIFVNTLILKFAKVEKE